MASAAWLRNQGLETENPHWYLEITIPADSVGVRFELNIYPEEWGFVFRHGRRVSSIRVTDVSFVHGQDDHNLHGITPALDGIKELLTKIERQHSIVFHRTRATSNTNLVTAAAIVRPWLTSK